ncbi:M81 family metallopeptidase [Oceanobacillus halotolerans]|uniref:M81 family metallopeptidase n=1 Tax=Oceanobacillus halotolerans TaxID=2663380 RepID=UPI0013D94DD8|nr:M81 family metallopeptidase [Oceanobacillus halotolerans]
MRIAIAQILHESNTFSNRKTTVDSFKDYEWNYGEDIVETHCGVRNYLGGMIDKGNELDVELIPTFSTYCNPSGTITKQTYERLKDELIKGIQSKPNLDAICIALHGGGVTENHEDLEGALLKDLRNVIGYDMPIIVTLDLHGNLTETMVEAATALLGVNHYPHTDTYDRGKEAIDLTVKIVRGEVLPKMSLVQLPLLIFPTTTYQSPAKDVNQLCWEKEKEKDVIDCTFFHGFARSDTAITGSSILSITNNNIKKAKRISEDVAREVWQLRKKFVHNHPSPENGIVQALETEDYPVVINETADNPGSGAPGDGTFLLEALLKKNIPGTCFGFMYDPSVVELAHRNGIGSTINVDLGGKTDSQHGEPLPVKAYVKSLTDGEFIQTSPMSKGATVKLGKSVRLQIGNVDVIVCSTKSQTLDEQIFLLHGIDVNQYKIVALKSSQHFRAAFQPIAQKIITVDSQGISTSNAFYYNYKKIQRPIYPLDKSCTFEV